LGALFYARGQNKKFHTDQADGCPSIGMIAMRSTTATPINERLFSECREAFKERASCPKKSQLDQKRPSKGDCTDEFDPLPVTFALWHDACLSFHRV
jgi:hypothetical protein